MDYALSKVLKSNETVNILIKQAKEYKDQQRADLHLNQKNRGRDPDTLSKYGPYVKPPQDVDR